MEVRFITAAKMYLRGMSYTESDRLAEELYARPDLEEQLQQLQTRLKTERERRKEFYEWLDEDKKAEFINGEIFVHSPVVKRHADATKNLTILLSTHVEVHELGFVGTEKILVQLRRNDFEPDVVFWRKPKSDDFEDGQLFFPAPDLVVEVLSPSTEKNNRTVKYDAYAANGVAEYWIVDSAKQSVECYELEGETYSEAVVVERGGRLNSKAAAGFDIPLAALFDRDTHLRTLRQILS